MYSGSPSRSKADTLLLDDDGVPWNRSPPHQFAEDNGFANFISRPSPVANRQRPGLRVFFSDIQFLCGSNGARDADGSRGVNVRDGTSGEQEAGLCGRSPHTDGTSALSDFENTSLGSRWADDNRRVFP